MKRTRIVAAGLTAAVAIPVALAAPASADVPTAWTKKTSICQSVSFYSQNPAYNDNLTPTHAVTGHKKFYYTSGDIVKGWMPVDSDGQSDWHTGWVVASCMADGWGYPDDGHVTY